MGIGTIKLLNACTAVATGDVRSEVGSTYSATGSVSASTGAVTVVIEVSNDSVGWITLGTITLSLGVSATSDGFSAFAAWAFVRAKVSDISGTGATVTVTMGV